MRKPILSFLLLFLFITITKQSKACHGLALVNFSYTVGGSGLTVNGSSSDETCGCGPYWMQIEIACTAAGVTGVPSTAIQNTLANWTGSGKTYNSHPWYNSIINLPNYTSANGWYDDCLVEPYNSIVVPWSSLCPGQTYYFAAREWLGGSNSAGPWSAVNSFTVPGTFVPLAASITATPSTICAGACSTVALSVTGGCGTQTISWSNGGSGTSISVCPGSTTAYTATLSTAASCQTVTRTATVTVVSPPAATFTATANQCLTGNSFTFTHTGSGGITAHSWNFGDGATGSGSPVSHSYASAGTYVVSHTAAIGGCTGTATVSVTVYPMPNTPTLTPTQPSCGLSNGSISVAASGGNSPYSYSLNGGGFQTGTSFTNLGPGTYTITVKTANGCVATNTVTLTNQPAPTNVTLTPANTGCGASTGSISVGAVTSGTATFSFSLNNASGPFTTGTSYTALAAGTYTVYVKDANGCTYNKTVVVGTATGPTAITFTTAPTACTSNTGSINITGVTGGTAAYQYSFNNGTSFGASNTATGLAAGSYTVIVKDVNNCTFTQVITVTTVASPTNITYSNTQPTCGQSNGAISATGVGGTPAYSFSKNGGPFQSSGSFTGLSAGTYSITVKDANGCTFTSTTSLTNSGSPTISVTGTVSPSCFGGTNGSVTVSVSGGATPYTYSITPGGTTNLTGAFSGLGQGTYTVTVTDNFSCTNTVTATITQPTAVTNSITATTNVSCNGGANGSLTASAGGGTSGYTYSLNGGTAQASPTFSGLSFGTYTITAIDSKGCQAQITGAITQPAALSLTLSSTNANCTAANGTASVVASGGTSPYTYAWTGGGGAAAATGGIATGAYTVTVTDFKGCVRTGSVTVGQTLGGTASVTNVTNVSCNGGANGSMQASITSTGATSYTYSWTPSGGTAISASSLSPGTYTVTITDNFGCVSTASATITQPAALSLTLSNTNVSCNGGADGTITATTTGGTSAYSYTWSPNVGTGNAVNSLPIGTYSCTVTDSKGCVATQSVAINQPLALSITSTVTNSTCNSANGVISVTGAGGFPAYSFSINNGAFGSSSTFSSLLAATYTITIRDQSLCTASFPVSIVNSAGPSVTIGTVNHVTCNAQCNGSAQAVVTGGSGTITYLWNNGQTTPIATNLCAGIYNVNATDANGCVATIGVTITQPTPLTSTATAVNPTCFGGSNGSATASVLGGISPYTFSWSTSPVQTTQTATGLSAGAINVIVTDSNGCTSTSPVTLVNPAQLLATMNGSGPVCFGACDGSASVSVSNGAAPLAYAWNDPNNQSTDTISGLCIGTFTVNVTDANGCTVSGSIMLTQPAAVVAMITSSGQATCSGTCDGFAVSSASGGNGMYSFSWTSGDISANANNLCVGDYTLTVTDHLGCQGTTTVTISEPNPLTLSATGTNITCFNACDGTATAAFSGGTPPYNFLWQPSLQQVFNATNLCAGSHTVTLTDSNGCNLQSIITLNEPNQLTTTIGVIYSHCLQSDGSALVNYSGGTEPVSIMWSNGVTTNSNAGIAGGVYNVTVTDSNGCVATNVANVNDINGPTVAIIDSSDITCFGYSDGVAIATVTAGTLPYSVVHWLPSGITTLNAGGLTPGMHTFHVVDSAGCNSSVNMTISEPSSFVSAISPVTPVTCFGLCNGNATMNATGGTPLANGSYNFIWTNGSTNAAQTTLCAGSYTCTATDSLGCSSTGTVTITQPQPLLINNVPGAQPVTCYGADNGSISVNVSGGNTPYINTWSPSIGNGPIITGLGPGVDTLTVTDNKGCIAQAIYTISEPTPIVLDSSVTNAVCGLANGSATVTASGGTPIAFSPFYGFAWNSSPNQTTPAATNLPGNTFICTVTDGNGCVATIPVVITDIPGPTVNTITQTPVVCNGQSNGDVTLVLNGGTSPFSYTWLNSGGTNQNQNSSTLSNVPAGTYAVTVIDNNGCSANAAIVVTQPNLLTLQANPQDTICFGQSSAVYCAAGGGIAPYTLSWTDGTNTMTGPGPHTVNPTSTTTYSVTVTDFNGCTIPGVQTMVLVTPPLSSATTDVSDCDKDTVQISATGSGGNGGPYTYTWSGVGTGQTQDVVADFNQSPKNYIVTISDGCSTPKVDTVAVTAFKLPYGQVIPNVANGCVELMVNFIVATDIGTSFIWNFGDGTSVPAATPTPITHTFVTDGVYDITLTVTSAQGCTTIVANPQMITVYPLPVADFSYVPSDPSILNPIVTFTNGSTGASTYNWNFGDLTVLNDTSTAVDPYYTYLVSGDYTVTLIAVSQYGCKDTTEQVIVVDPAFAVFVPNAFSPNGDGLNDEFLPKGVGINEDKYKLIIFDRWGANIFESNNWSTGWDGKANGGADVAQEDVFVWRILLYDWKGTKHSLTGRVTVVK
jgi:gliding motility-associated-like protein